jgi:hypothetical protein
LHGGDNASIGFGLDIGRDLWRLAGLGRQTMSNTPDPKMFGKCFGLAGLDTLHEIGISL